MSVNFTFIRGTTGALVTCMFASLEELMVKLRSECERESVFLLTEDGAKVPLTELLSRPQSEISACLVLFFRADFSEVPSGPISDETGVKTAMTVLSRFLQRRRDAFDQAIAAFWTAVELHSHKTTEMLTALDATLASLKKVDLHVSLVSDERKTLFDVVPHSRISEFKTVLDRQISDLLIKMRLWKAQAEEVCETMDILIAGLREHNPDRRLLADFGRAMAAVRKTEMAGVLLEEAFSRSRKSLGQLQHLEKMPLAYEKTLSEIPRRKVFKDKYLAKMAAYRTELAAMRKEENDRRLRYFNKYGVHLPSGLIPGLSDTATQVTIELLEDFDADLPLVIGNSSQLSSSSMEPAGSAAALAASTTRFLHPSTPEY